MFYKEEIIKIASIKIINIKHGYTMGIIIDFNFIICCMEGLLMPLALKRKNRPMFFFWSFLKGFNVMLDTFIL